MERLISGYRLIEGPTVDDSGALLFSDTVAGGVRRLCPDGTVEDVIPHRRGVGGIAIHADGGLVVSGRNISWKRGDQTTVLYERQHPDQSFNDLTADPDGRIYVGSLEFNPLDPDSPRASGNLYLIDLDGEVSEAATDVQLTNGLGVSPDGTRLYHSDTEAHVVWSYDRGADGRVTNRRPLCTFSTEEPDGLAVAEDGSVWVAMATSGEVVVITAEGEVADRISVEVPMVTSVCFGGDDLQDLYVVTGERGAPSDLMGSVYRMRAPVAGLPVPKARIRP